MFGIAELNSDGVAMVYLAGRQVIKEDGGETLLARWTDQREHACMYMSEADAMRVAEDIALGRRLKGETPRLEVFPI